MRADGAPSEVDIVLSDNFGGEFFFAGNFWDVCRQYCIKREFTNAKSPELNGVAERALGIIKNVALAASSFPTSNCHHRRHSGLRL